MQMSSGAYLNMEPVTFILPVFPAWSFSQYHDLQEVFIHASSASPLHTLLSGQHHVLHGWATGKWRGERGDYQWLTGEPADGCDGLSFSDRSWGLQHASTSMHEKHPGVSVREGKHHIGQRTGEERTTNGELADVSSYIQPSSKFDRLSCPHPSRPAPLRSLPVAIEKLPRRRLASRRMSGPLRWRTKAAHWGVVCPAKMGRCGQCGADA